MTCVAVMLIKAALFIITKTKHVDESEVISALIKRRSHSGVKGESTSMSEPLTSHCPTPLIFQFAPPVKWVSKCARQTLCGADVCLTHGVQ